MLYIFIILWHFTENNDGLLASVLFALYPVIDNKMTSKDTPAAKKTEVDDSRDIEEHGYSP